MSQPRREGIADYRVDADAGIVYGARGKPVGSLDSSGYVQIDGRTRGLGILSAHRLVWERARGPIPVGMEVNHRNGIKTDNRIANLDLVTHRENIRHAYRTGLKSNRGESHPSHVLTEGDVVAIRRRYRRGAARSLAHEFGIGRRAISDIVRRKTWSHVAEVA